MRRELAPILTRGQLSVPDELYGEFIIQGPCGVALCIISAQANEPIAEGWEHVSVSTRRRCPNWIEMCFVKRLFWFPEETVIQFHPPEADYVNNHPYCLHLWRDTLHGHRLPPTLLVGIKGVQRNADGSEVPGAQATEGMNP